MGEDLGLPCPYQTGPISIPCYYTTIILPWGAYVHMFPCNPTCPFPHQIIRLGSLRWTLDPVHVLSSYVHEPPSIHDFYHAQFMHSTNIQLKNFFLCFDRTFAISLGNNYIASLEKSACLLNSLFNFVLASFVSLFVHA